MTEFDIQKSLIDVFKTLNTFSQIEFLKIENGEYKNVHLPNISFSEPEDKRYFDLTFRNNEGVPIGMLPDSQERITGVLYIDVYTPKDSGESEAETKCKWIKKLYHSNNGFFDDSVIKNIYISTKGADGDKYRLQLAVEWEADIDKES